MPISLSDMEEKAVQGYRLWYSPNTKGLTTYRTGELKLAEIPDFVKLLTRSEWQKKA